MSASKLSAAIAKEKAGRLQSLIRARGDYAHVSVRARGVHLLVEAESQSSARYLIARATSIGRDQYDLSFRTHTGRWEPLPVLGTIEDLAEGLTTLLAPHLEREDR